MQVKPSFFHYSHGLLFETDQLFHTITTWLNIIHMCFLATHQQYWGTYQHTGSHVFELWPQEYMGLVLTQKSLWWNNTASLFLSRGSHIIEGEWHLYLLGPLLGEYLRWYTTSSDDFEEGCQITWDVKGVLLPNSCSRKVLDNVSLLNNHKLSSSLWTRPGPDH